GSGGDGSRVVMLMVGVVFGGGGSRAWGCCGDGGGVVVDGSRVAAASEGDGNLNPTASSFNPPADQIETLTVESPIPTVSSPVPTACLNDSPEPSSEAKFISKRVANQEETPSLDNILLLTNRDFILLDDANILLRTPRQHNMYSIDLNYIVPHRDLTCLVVKASAGIKREFNNARTPQQNRVAERRNRTLIETARTMLADAKLPVTFWAKVNTACYVQNRVLVNKSQNKTPFFLKSKDETSDILKKFITEIENLKDLKVKIIRRNKSLIEAAKTMLVDAKLPVTFWAEAVNTTSYVQNRVLVNKAHNKTPYELFNGRTPAIRFLKRFGCHVMILNTLGNLENRENDKIGSKPDKNGKRGEARRSQKQSQSIKQEKTEENTKRRAPPRFQDPEFLTKVYKVEKLCMDYIREFEALMHEKFQMSAMGELNFFLGLQVLQKEDGIFLSQDKYVRDILKKFRYSEVRSSNTPMDKENHWGKDGTGKDVDLHLYRSMIGSLIYLTASRPDIMFAVCACARHQYPKESPFDLVAYSDSDYGGATQDRKSTTRGCQFLGRRLISWQCKKQTIVATSTTEAEYVAAASCCGQVLWI
nr:uncharacterized mitochondrial protein AtMg00810-like [Tanacetum cinerariifolium]